MTTKTERYRITQPGVRLVRNGPESPVGAVVNLTAQKADALINKVALFADQDETTNALAASVAQVVVLQEELNGAREIMAELREEVGALKTAVASANAHVAEALATSVLADTTRIAEMEDHLAGEDDRIAEALATSVPADTTAIAEALATSVLADTKRIAKLEKDLKAATKKVPAPPK